MINILPCMRVAQKQSIIIGAALLFVCLSLFPIHTYAAIAVDVSGAANCTGDGACTQSSNASAATLTNAHTLTYTFTVGSGGSNKFLIVSLHTDGSCVDNNGLGAATSTSVTYGGNALGDNLSG